MKLTEKVITQLEKEYPKLDSQELRKVLDFDITSKKESDIAVINILGNIDEQNPDWTFVAATVQLVRLYATQFGVDRAINIVEGKDSYYKERGMLQKYLDENKEILNESLFTYSESEVQQLNDAIELSRDKLFTYIGLRTLTDRYLLRTGDGQLRELPQERFMSIAMHTHHKETDNRIQKVIDAYWAMSNLYMTVATPTLANAGKSRGNLASCFIDTVEDSLDGIYQTNADVANLSKWGGGIGISMGKVRAKGSSIRGNKGASSGVVPWIKGYNNTAVSVDQLGTRNGAIAIYLDVFHLDIIDFLDLKLNNGDERLRAHDIFTGVSVPDLFMQAVEDRADWYLFDPYEVKQKYGKGLEDTFDDTVKGEMNFTKFYNMCVADEDLRKTKIPAIDIMKRIMRSQLETGTPFMFYRDTVNSMNPNKHEGMIYSSNLC